MKNVIFNLLPAIFLWLGGSYIASAQDPSTACCDVIELDGDKFQDYSTKGEFDAITVAPLQTSTITLKFPDSLSSKPVIVQALDGGTLGIDGESAATDQDAKLSFPFSVSDQPGVYRVLVIGDASDGPLPLAVVKFQVPNPEQ